MAVPARFYDRFAEALRAHGWSTDIVARRGIEEGDTPPSRAADWSYRDEADLLSRAISERRAQSDGPVLLAGHSIGAQLGQIVARGADDGRPDGIVAVAGSVPFFARYPLRSGLPLLAMGLAVFPVGVAAGHWPTPGFGAPGARTLMREWATMVVAGRAPFPTDGANQIPTLSISLEGDTFVTESACRAYERATDPAALTRWTYTAGDCPPQGSTDHVRWVRHPEAVVDRIVEWWSAAHTETPSSTSATTAE